MSRLKTFFAISFVPAVMALVVLADVVSAAVGPWFSANCTTSPTCSVLRMAFNQVDYAPLDLSSITANSIVGSKLNLSTPPTGSNAYGYSTITGLRTATERMCIGTSGSDNANCITNTGNVGDAYVYRLLTVDYGATAGGINLWGKLYNSSSSYSGNVNIADNTAITGYATVSSYLTVGTYLNVQTTSNFNQEATFNGNVVLPNNQSLCVGLASGNCDNFNFYYPGSATVAYDLMARRLRVGSDPTCAGYMGYGDGCFNGNVNVDGTINGTTVVGTTVSATTLQGTNASVSGAYQYDSVKTYYAHAPFSSMIVDNTGGAVAWAFLLNAPESVGVGVSTFLRGSVGVDLPDGAIVTLLRCNLYDTDGANNIGVKMYRVTDGDDPASGEMASVITDSNGGYFIKEDNTIQFATVANSTYFYMLEIIPEAASTALGYSNCRITYTLANVSQ